MTATAANPAPAAARPLIEVEGLAYSYAGAIAVSDVSFRVSEGEVVALVGSNGTGKSTTVKMIAGVLRARQGRIRFDGEETTARRSHDIVERGITLVPEGRLVFPRMTVEENLKIGAYPRRARAHQQENADRIFDLFPRLAERRTQLAGLMSGGEQQMLAIARGLMSHPRLLILDEPSLGLMPTMVEHLFQLITKIRASGISIILVEQNVFQTLEIADRAYVLEKGRTTLEGTGQELLGNDYVRKAFLGL